MSAVARTASSSALYFFQSLTLMGLLALAVGLGTTSGLALFGVLPWLDVAVTYGGQSVQNAGMILQLGLTGFAVSLFLFLPSHRRMMKLEKSHRDFTISMDDVAQAYRASHAADRQGAFNLSSEFDSVRERINHLRDHPSLEELEPGLLEVAAQMSHESRDIAQTYSEDRVARARAFLAQRQEEIDTHMTRIELARKTCDELRRWSQEVAVEEGLVEQQLDRLEEDLKELLPLIGFEMGDEVDPEPVAQKVVQMSPKPAE